MSVSYTDIIIDAANAGTGCRLTAEQCRELVSDVKQMSHVLVFLQSNDFHYVMNTDRDLQSLIEWLFGPLLASGFRLSTNGELWWLQPKGHEHVSCADTFAEAYADALREIGAGPPSGFKFSIDGQEIYQHLLDAASQVPVT